MTRFLKPKVDILLMHKRSVSPSQLRNSGGLEPLVELLRSKNDEVRRHASWAMTVCASDELMATELCRLG